MTKKKETEIKIPIIREAVGLCRKIVLPGFSGLSLFDLLEIYATGIIKGTFSSRASAIAYSFFVAIFPFLLLMLNLISFIKVSGFKERFLGFIEEMLPPQTQDFFYPIIEDIAINQRGGLLSFVFVLSIFLAANGVNAIFSAFEYSIHVNINRAFFKQYFVALVVAVFVALLLLITVTVIIWGEFAISELTELGYMKNDVFWISALQITVFVIMFYIIIATLYHFGVKEGRKTRFLSLGALVTTLLFLATTYLFGVYINNFSSYNELYGSIGALLIMMFYIWINSNLLLLGFELDISLQRLKDKCAD